MSKLKTIKELDDEYDLKSISFKEFSDKDELPCNASFNEVNAIKKSLDTLMNNKNLSIANIRQIILPFCLKYELDLNSTFRFFQRLRNVYI